MNQVAYAIGERRGEPLDQEQHWERMTADQKMALYDLNRFGYRLLFVRMMPEGPLAVVSQQSELAVIDFEGEVNLRPDIKLREESQ
ncbi:MULTISPECIES: hypothetical protein [Shewanella]|uniref:hypothetical protein n=1 Tax=Shewanella TaxID=22 RepID=UPI0006D68AD9|nr:MULTISPECIES: hypothetical protein [Shewanella]KPZ72274.1 hypothetical protein AN944_01052 [Shewanella sp. P1-14-1]MBQ4889365.1 hypothetical protein [Shewanella sp. MMG014]